MDKNIKIWLLLMSLTLLSYLIAVFGLIDSGAVVVLLFITLLKGQLIIDYFMGLREVRLSYRLIPIIWLIMVLSLILVAYLI